MPELPDVEIYKQYFERTSRGQKIRKVIVRDRRILSGISPQELDSRLKHHSFYSLRSLLQHAIAGFASEPPGVH